MFAAKRLQKELQKMNGTLPPGITLVNAPNLEEWIVDLQVVDPNPIYVGKIFRLRFRFSDKYPIKPPEVQFITPPASANTPRPIPVHPHIYTNGIICLDLLGAEGWSPVCNVEAVCVSLQSMLTGNTKNERPQGDEDFVRRAGIDFSTGGRARTSNRGAMGFVYDDDTV